MKGRSQVVARIQRLLVKRGLPRIQMTMMVTATGLAGFGASVVLLQLGVSSMPVRYSLAVIIAYTVFLLLVRLWVEYQRRGFQADAEIVDVLPPLMPGAGNPASSEPSLYGGGTFGGGGAQRAWTGSGPSGIATPMHELPVANPMPASTSDLSIAAVSDIDLDDAWIIVVPALVLVAGVVAAVWVIYTAPVLLAELLLDVALVSGLYRRLRKLEPQSWLLVVVRRTWIPFTAVILSLVAGGFLMQSLVPEADSIGDVVKVVGR